MYTKQVVAVIGASGKMGSSLGRNLSKGNYRVLLCSSKADMLQSLLNEIKSRDSSADVDIVDDAVEASWEADIIIPAVPYSAEKQVAEHIRSVVNQKVIISISRRTNDSDAGFLTLPRMSSAEELQQQLPNAKVIKAFTMVAADICYQPANGDRKVDCFVAGNDRDAVEVVYDLVKAAGFHPVVVGDLTISRTLESMQLLVNQLMTSQRDNKDAEGQLCRTDYLTH